MQNRFPRTNVGHKNVMIYRKNAKVKFKEDYKLRHWVAGCLGGGGEGAVFMWLECEREQSRGGSRASIAVCGWVESLMFFINSRYVLLSFHRMCAYGSRPKIMSRTIHRISHSF